MNRRSMLKLLGAALPAALVAKAIAKDEARRPLPRLPQPVQTPLPADRPLFRPLPPFTIVSPDGKKRAEPVYDNDGFFKAWVIYEI